MKDQKIMIVDDEESNVLLLERILAKEGYSAVVSTTDARQVFRLFATHEPDLLLLDLNMPHRSGFEVMEQLKELIPADAFVPILVLTADVTAQTKHKALAAGARDFLTKPFDHTEVLLRIRNLIEMRVLHLQVRNQNQILEQRVREALQELKAAQQQVIHQARMHSLGLMARGIAHDFNNALSVILGFGEIVLNDLRAISNMEGIATSMEIIVTAAMDAAKMVDRLKEFHRPADGKEVSRSVDLNLLIKQAVTFTEPRWRNEALENGVVIDIGMELGDIPPILGDSAELREVLTNLIFNAVDAMPQGGAITLRTSAGVGKVVLEISDTGTGMTEEVRQRCLEPFFTTKGDRGTGLGLAMVYGIIERRGGTVEIESEVDKGTTFKFCFPSKAASGESVEARPSKLDYSLRILIVDDQPILCDVMVQYLKQDFHTVDRAANGIEALEKLNAGAFDLVITGQAMPGMNGNQFAEAVKAMNPGMPVIMLTGFGSAGDTLPEAVDLVLGKPVSLTALRNAVAEVIRAR